MYEQTCVPQLRSLYLTDSTTNLRTLKKNIQVTYGDVEDLLVRQERNDFTQEPLNRTVLALPSAEIEPAKMPLQGLETWLIGDLRRHHPTFLPISRIQRFGRLQVSHRMICRNWNIHKTNDRVFLKNRKFQSIKSNYSGPPYRPPPTETTPLQLQ